MSSAASRHRRLSALSLGTAFLFAMLLLMTLQWYFKRADIADDFSSLGSVIGTNAAAALVFDDERTGGEILSSLAQAPDVLEAGLFRRDGSALATYRRGTAASADNRMEDMLNAASPSFTLREIRLTVPVTANNDRVGTLVLRVSQQDVYGDVVRFLAGFLLISLMALGLARLVTRGLRRQVSATEHAQRESDARLRSVTDHLPVVLFQAIAGADRVYRFAYVSDSAQQLLGIAPDALLADCRPFLDGVHTEDLAALATLLSGATAAQGEPLTWTGRYRHRPADEIWIEIRASLTAEADGRTSISGIMQDVSQIRHYQDAVEQSRLMLQQLASHRENLVDEEHKKIAVEIHDQLGQILTAALFHLRVLGRALPPADKNGAALVADIDALLNEAYRSMKDIAASLRPAVLNFGFATAAEWAAERALKNTAVKYRVEVQDPLPELDERQATTFFRIVQEALSNCTRHANAANVTISLSVQNDALVLTIADDGQGLDDSAVGKGMHLGLLGMRERAMALGGTASIANQPSHGVIVTVVVPQAAT